MCRRIVPGTPYLRHDTLVWLRCHACRFGFQYPYVSEHRRDDRRDIEATYQGFDEDTIPPSVIAEKCAWVLHDHGAESDVLCVELGPGRGQLMQALQQARPGWRCIGVEPFPLFQQALRAKGLEVCDSLTTLAPMAATRSRRYSRMVVVADNVLEHLEHPVEVLRSLMELARHLAVPVQVLVEVPNERGLSWRYRLQDWLRGTPKPPTFPGHINLFEAQSLAAAGKAAGFAHSTVADVGIRTTDQVAYVMRKPVESAKIAAVVSLLDRTALDTMMGYGYWLRARFEHP
jgi:hypothetical protein